MRNRPYLYALLFLLLTSLPTYAAWVTTELDSPQYEEGPRISLQYLQTQYATDATLGTQANSYQYVMPRLYTASEKKSAFQYELDFNGVLPTSEAGESHYFFPNLYVGLNDNKRGLSVHFGRKENVWSELDSELNLGLWQPLFRWDHARPVQMGLTGFHFESRQRYFIFNAMISPFFLPDQQADFEVKDGEIISGNRWFRRPIHTIEFGNDDTSVRYDVNKPEVKEVVMNESYAFSARLGPSKGAFLKAAWADKPMNQFHLGVDLEDSLRLALNEFNAQVYPQVVRHELITLESGYVERDFRSFISFTAERFEDPKLPEDWEETELIDSNYLGLGIEHRAPLPFLPNSRLTWAFARRDLLDDSEDIVRIEGELDSSTQRLPFEDWFTLKWDAKKPFGKSRSVTSSLAYNYSPSDDGDWMALDVSLNWTKQWQWYLSADLFGASNYDEIENRSFISMYRNNDRLQGGFVYVF